MLEQVQSKKLSHLFDILDANKNELLQPDDFAIVAERMSNILQYEENSKERLQLKLKSLRLFVQLLIDMGKEDTNVSREEWMDFFGTLATNSPKSYINRTATYIFHLFDQNQDYRISKEEYLDMFKVYNIDLEYSAKGFELLDENGDGEITMEEMTNGFNDFLLSDKEDAAGNWIFGKWDK